MNQKGLLNALYGRVHSYASFKYILAAQRHRVSNAAKEYVDLQSEQTLKELRKEVRKLRALEGD